MRRHMKVTLAAAAAAALALTLSTRAQAQDPAQQPDIDLEAVHNAYWSMGGANHVEALQWFEQEVNKYYYGDDYVSVAAERVPADGYNYTRVTGYVDRDGVPGYNPEGDETKFQFAQTGPIAGNTVPYEFLDSWGNVYYRGARAVPYTPFYTSYYVNWRAPIGLYYTSPARIGYLRTWRLGWRASPVYVGWRGRFVTWRAGYGRRVIGLRTRYGVPRARVFVRPRYRVGVGVRRGVVRPGVRVRVAPRRVAPRVRVRVGGRRRR